MTLEWQTSVTRPSPGLRWKPGRADVYGSDPALSIHTQSPEPSAAKVLAPPTTVEKRASLLRELSDAMQRSVSQHLDVPSSDSVTRAQGLLSRLVLAVEDSSIFEVFVADDGTIEITASPRNRFITIDVSPRTGRIAVVVQDSAGGTLCADQNASDEEVVRQVERAA